MNLTKCTRQIPYLLQRASLAAGSMQTIVGDHSVVKHAMGSHLKLNLSCATATPGIDRKPLLRVEYRVSDDGRGFDPNDFQPDHHGLSIICVRTSTTGADRTVGSQPYQGTEIVVTRKERQ